MPWGICVCVGVGVCAGVWGGAAEEEEAEGWIEFEEAACWAGAVGTEKDKVWRNGERKGGENMSGG